jgi:hypothetical protein
MTRDAVLLAVLLIAFAALVTAHVMLAFGLARRSPRWHAAVAFVLVPLAPWWGWRSGMRGRGAVWVVAALAYTIALWMSLR